MALTPFVLQIRGLKFQCLGTCPGHRGAGEPHEEPVAERFSCQTQVSTTNASSPKEPIYSFTRVFKSHLFLGVRRWARVGASGNYRRGRSFSGRDASWVFVHQPSAPHSKSCRV